jgi:hypothetical protein
MFSFLCAYVVVGCCRGVDCMTVWVVVERGFNREAFVGMESDSLSVDGDRADEKTKRNKEEKNYEIKKPERLSCVRGRRVVGLESGFVLRGIGSLSTACKRKIKIKILHDETIIRFQYFLNNSRTQLASNLRFSPIDREITIPPSLEGSVFR